MQPPLRMQRCAFCLLSLKGPWRSCCPATFLDLSLSPLQLVGNPPPHCPLFPLLNPLGPSQSSFSILACGSRSHFHVSGTPISVTASCPPVSLENSQPSLISSRRGDSALPNLSSANTSHPDHHLGLDLTHTFKQT